jgi:hypothetical protein
LRHHTIAPELKRNINISKNNKNKNLLIALSPFNRKKGTMERGMKLSRSTTPLFPSFIGY